MQPDPLSAENEKNQPEPGVPQDITPTETPSMSAAEPLEPAPVVKVEAQKQAVARKKPPKWIYVVLGMLIVLIFATFAWVGYWAYMLSTDLASTQQQLTALQAEHEKLQTDYTALSNTNDKLTKDLTQSKADLEKANTDLATAQADLKKAQDKNQSLTAKTDKAGKLAEVLYAWSNVNEASDILEINSLVDASDNQDLMDKWAELTKSPSDETFGAFLDYLVNGIRLTLK